MKASMRFFMSMMLMIAVSMVLTSCGGDDNGPTATPGVSNPGGTDGGGTGSNDVKQKILGTWKCNDENGYTVITFTSTGISEWKYLFDDEVTRWTWNYEINEQRLVLYEDGTREEYNYTLTSTTLTFDGDEYVKIDNYVDEDEPNSGGETQGDTQYDNRGAVAQQFRGSGTKSNPYIISDATELRKLADDVEGGKTYRDEYFKVTADIVVNRSVATNNTGELTVNVSTLEQWKPIGKGQTPFCGTFDGGGHTISGIFIQKSERDSLGLFGYLAGTVQSVKLLDSYVEGKNSIGGLVGMAEKVTYSKDYAPNISSCVNYCVVKGANDGKRQGGVVGSLSGGTISNTLNYGLVIGNSYVGGIIGMNLGSDVKNCANWGGVKGSNHLGGVTGGNAYLNKDGKRVSSELHNCFNYGDVTAISYLGGVIGVNNRSYASNLTNYGKITCLSTYSSVGALVGFSNLGNFLSNSYFLETSYPVGCGSSNQGTPKNIQSMTSNQMKAQTFLDELNKNAKALGSSYSQWKFGIDGYPIFSWINE